MRSAVGGHAARLNGARLMGRLDYASGIGLADLSTVADGAPGSKIHNAGGRIIATCEPTGIIVDLAVMHSATPSRRDVVG